MALLNSWSVIGSPASKVLRIMTGVAVTDIKQTHDPKIKIVIRITESDFILYSILTLKKQEMNEVLIIYNVKYLIINRDQAVDYFLAETIRRVMRFVSINFEAADL